MVILYWFTDPERFEDELTSVLSYRADYNEFMMQVIPNLLSIVKALCKLVWDYLNNDLTTYPWMDEFCQSMGQNYEYMNENDPDFQCFSISRWNQIPTLLRGKCPYKPVSTKAMGIYIPSTI